MIISDNPSEDGTYRLSLSLEDQKQPHTTYYRGVLSYPVYVECMNDCWWLAIEDLRNWTTDLEQAKNDALAMLTEWADNQVVNSIVLEWREKYAIPDTMELNELYSEDTLPAVIDALDAGDRNDRLEDAYDDGTSRIAIVHKMHIPYPQSLNTSDTLKVNSGSSTVDTGIPTEAILIDGTNK